MYRSITTLAAAAFVLAACGGTASAARTSPSPTDGNAFRNGASGQLVQINAQTLILSGPNGDITVSYTLTTTFNKTRVATLADIARGTCIVANGQKDTIGAITATTVRISPKTATGCAPRAFGPSPAPGASPPANATPRPSAQPNAAFVTGEVTSVAGPAVTVLTQTGSQQITVASAATVTETSTVSSADLQTGQCIRANGSRDSAGDVQAISITISPAGPSGTCTSGFGGGGRGQFGGNPPPGSGRGG